MVIVTPYMLRQKLYEVNQMSSNQNNVTAPTTANAVNTEEESSEVKLYKLRITKVQGNTMIANDNTKWLMYNSIPGVEWTCTGLTTGNGVCTLEHPFDAIGISDGTINYILGLLGATDEFEVRIISSNTKVQVQKEFVSVQTPHLLKNGIEEK